MDLQAFCIEETFQLHDPFLLLCHLEVGDVLLGVLVSYIYIAPPPFIPGLQHEGRSTLRSYKKMFTWGEQVEKYGYILGVLTRLERAVLKALKDLRIHVDLQLVINHSFDVPGFNQVMGKRAELLADDRVEHVHQPLPRESFVLIVFRQVLHEMFVVIAP